ncbi:photosynthetic protein synthase II [Capnocytophaga canis]|uniref:SCO family protein n=1 Tax=Capnocytophaga canis TaxID=1848903 RepID=UPI001AD21AB1|nr:SCO family protein [Capnocytophaga canis]GIM61917.1 photosynthetic protein synthase II [Capnocytophaga canis]
MKKSALFLLFIVVFGCTSHDSKLVIIGKAPKFSLTNQHNQTVTNDTYKGKVYVAEFFFTSCPSICPIMTKNTVKIQNTFPNEDRLGFVSFSINPDFDTPEILKSYADVQGIKSPNWHLLTGEEDTIYDLANEGFNLHAKVDDAAEGGFEHSGLFALIDTNGNIVSRKDVNGNPIIYYNGLDEEHVKMLIEDIQFLLQ